MKAKPRNDLRSTPYWGLASMFRLYRSTTRPKQMACTGAGLWPARPAFTYTDWVSGVDSSHLTPNDHVATYMSGGD